MKESMLHFLVSFAAKPMRSQNSEQRKTETKEQNTENTIPQWLKARAAHTMTKIHLWFLQHYYEMTRASLLLLLLLHPENPKHRGLHLKIRMGMFQTLHHLPTKIR
jgi:hypothetical protein